mgnify:CR=1 FL=1
MASLVYLRRVRERIIGLMVSSGLSGKVFVQLMINTTSSQFLENIVSRPICLMTCSKERRRRKQSRARGAVALEKGTLFYMSKKARTLKFRRLPVFIKPVFHNGNTL